VHLNRCHATRRLTIADIQAIDLIGLGLDLGGEVDHCAAMICRLGAALGLRRRGSIGTMGAWFWVSSTKKAPPNTVAR
jgi:hypothetical protein